MGVDYLVLGSLVHVLLAYVHARKLAVKPPWWNEPIMPQLSRIGAGFPKLIDQALRIAAAYATYWGEDTGWAPETIEHEYSATLGEIRALYNPYREPLPDDHEVFSCRIDLLVRSNGYLFGVDYKTTKGSNGRLPTFNNESEHAMSWQFHLQHAILRVRLGTEFRGIIVERILKQEPFVFARDLVPISPVTSWDLSATLSRLAAMETEVENEAALMEGAGADMEVWLPSGNWWNCHSGGRACEYRAACVAEGVDERKSTLVRLYKSAD